MSTAMLLSQRLHLSSRIPRINRAERHASRAVCLAKPRNSAGSSASNNMPEAAKKVALAAGSAIAPLLSVGSAMAVGGEGGHLLEGTTVYHYPICL